MFESTADKVLKALIDTEGIIDISERLNAVKNSLPSISSQQIHSAISELRNADLIAVEYREGELCDLIVRPYALSRLTTKRELKIWHVKWDIAKIALGYGCGFVSAWLLK